jgi:hypothetical protein
VVLLGALVAAAAALGAAQSPTSRAPLSPEAQSELFHTDVTRTLASKSFTVHFAGQTTAYQAPDRTQVVETDPGPVGLGMHMVAVGSSSYIDFGGQWSKVPFVPIGLGDSSEVLGYLRALSSFKTASLHGDIYTVHGVLSGIPQALVTLIFTVVMHSPNNQIETTLAALLRSVLHRRHPKSRTFYSCLPPRWPSAPELSLSSGAGVVRSGPHSQLKVMSVHLRLDLSVSRGHETEVVPSDRPDLAEGRQFPNPPRHFDHDRSCRMGHAGRCRIR